MTLIVGACAHGSPGTTSALLLLGSVWPGKAPVLVEGDLAGGVVCGRFEVSSGLGLVTLAEVLRKGDHTLLFDHAQRLPSGLAVLACPPSASAAEAAVRNAGVNLGQYLAGINELVLFDAGTLLPASSLTSVVSSADLLIWFVRPTREELLILQYRLAELASPQDCVVVLVGTSPYRGDEVAAALGIEVLHTLPVDRRGAAALNLGGDDSHLRRSALVRSASVLAVKIARRLSLISSVDDDTNDTTGDLGWRLWSKVSRRVERASG